MIWWDKLNKAAMVANGLSVIRGVMGLFLPFFVLSTNVAMHWWAAIIFTVAAITDYFDGWVARRYGGESPLGKILDPSMDKILILGPLVAFSTLGFFSPWWVVPIFIREFLVTFCRIGWMLEGRAVGAEKLGKVKFCVQVVLLALVFLHLLDRHYAFYDSVMNVLDFSLLACLVLTLGLTLVSGVQFTKINQKNFQTPAFAKFTSACGVGLIPKMPGTLGSLLALILIPLSAWNLPLYLAIFVFLLWVGYWSVHRLDLSENKDPQFVVIDEVLGMYVAFLLIPINAFTLLAGFFLFRFFDILKPFPCRRLESLPGYWGIAADDLGAGIYAWAILFTILHL